MRRRIESIYVIFEHRKGHSAQVIHNDMSFKKYYLTRSSYLRLERLAKKLSKISSMFGRIGATKYAMILHRPPEGD